MLLFTAFLHAALSWGLRRGFNRVSHSYSAACVGLPTHIEKPGTPFGEAGGYTEGGGAKQRWYGIS